MGFAVRMRLVVELVIPLFIYCDCVYFALDSYSLRWRLMLVSGMSIVEGFLTIFLVFRTNFGLFFDDFHEISACLFNVLFGDWW
jgi:hypothetical protein